MTRLYAGCLLALSIFVSTSSVGATSGPVCSKTCSCEGDWTTELKLDPRQCSEYRELFHNYYVQLDELYEQSRANQRKIVKLMSAENLSTGDINQAAQERAKITQEQVRLSLGSLQSFRKMLKPQQLEVLKDQDEWLYYWQPYEGGASSKSRGF